MDSQQLNDILQRLAAGELDVAAAAKALSSLETADLGFAQIDHQRAVRCGFSEVIYGDGKSADQIAAIIRNFLENASNVLVTRLNDTAATVLSTEFPQAVHVPNAGLFAVFHHQPEKRHGRVAVLSAGTSDGAVADEASETLRFFGFEPRCISDVGVAGLHRLLARLDELVDCQVIIAVAGMEGALPSVVGGLVRAPVIAVPTSVGYGTSYDGITALLAMLNSCASGVTVTNIDNGFGAACAAIRILNAT